MKPSTAVKAVWLPVYLGLYGPNKNYQCKLVSNNVYPLHELVLMTAWSCNEIYEYEYWSALSIAPTSALAGAKEANNSTD